MGVGEKFGEASVGSMACAALRVSLSNLEMSAASGVGSRMSQRIRMLASVLEL